MTPAHILTRTALRHEGDPRDFGAAFEAPLYTVPYPLDHCGDACLDARDLDMDVEDGMAPSFSQRNA